MKTQKLYFKNITLKSDMFEIVHNKFETKLVINHYSNKTVLFIKGGEIYKEEAGFKVLLYNATLKSTRADSPELVIITRDLNIVVLKGGNSLFSLRIESDGNVLIDYENIFLTGDNDE